jgi:hypothetical protein
VETLKAFFVNSVKDLRILNMYKDTKVGEKATYQSRLRQQEKQQLADEKEKQKIFTRHKEGQMRLAEEREEHCCIEATTAANMGVLKEMHDAVHTPLVLLALAPDPLDRIPRGVHPRDPRYNG